MAYVTEYRRKPLPIRALIWLRWMPMAYVTGCWYFMRWLADGAKPYPRLQGTSDEEHEWFIRHGGGRWLLGRMSFTHQLGIAAGMMGDTIPIDEIVSELREKIGDE
jgi:hypothetical protein